MIEPLPIITPHEQRQDERDVATIRLLRKGDEEGLRRLLVDHAGHVGERLRREFQKVLDGSEIDDALNQASMRVWAAGSRLDESAGTLRAWFYVVARNCALRVLETKRRTSALGFIEDLDSEPATRHKEPDPPRPATSRFIIDMYRCIDALPTLQRRVILADLAAGGTAPAGPLAEQLRTTRNSIYVSRTNGRKALKDSLLRLGHAFGLSQQAVRPGEGKEIAT